MFYNNGTVFQSTFDQVINAPKLGENLAELLNHIKNVYSICNFKLDNYRKLIFETEDISVIIIKLGEESNIALFFKEEVKDIKLSSIKRYLTRIEELIDMDEKEITFQELLVKEEELKIKKDLLESNSQKARQLQEELKKLGISEYQEESKKIERELNYLNTEIINLKSEIDHINIEIQQLKEQIEKD